MEQWLKQAELLAAPDEEECRSPIPTGNVGNGEIPPLPRSGSQRLVERRVMELADLLGSRLGMDRRRFLRTGCGMAAAFMAMNSVHGPLFAVSPAEAADPAAALEREQALARQFIFDVQTHFVSDDYPGVGLLRLRKGARKWNPALQGEKLSPEKIRYGNYVKELFLDSDTTLALLSSAPSDDPQRWFLNNDELAQARREVNDKAGSKRLFSHALVTPGQPGWLEELDRAIAELKPDSWKGYTVGAPSTFSRWPWRLDDEKLVYPAYERMVKAGIVNVCIHKGLIHPAVRGVPASRWRHGKVDDLGRAARDWPQLNFIIYHSAIRYLGEPGRGELSLFERNGEIPWVSELARTPEKYGVKNVYGELGSVFAATAVSNPRYCAAILGTLVKGLGPDHVLWGTDSVWYGSPQWQIEALRRLEIPAELQKRLGFAPLGPADGEVKSAIFGGNAARLYNLKVPDGRAGRDKLALLRERYRAAGGERSNRTYGVTG